MEWKAIHFFIHDNTFHNQFLVEYLKPEIECMEREQVLTQYFYIVYWQGGNHIRFRYKSVNALLVEKRVISRYKSFLEIYEPRYVMQENTYYEIYSKNKENVQDITFIPDRTVRRMRYEPEIERYGGFDSLKYSECIFSLSSKYALQIREQAGDSMMRRIIGSLDMFTLAIKGLEDKKKFLSLYRRFWSDFAPDNGRTFISVANLSAKYKERYGELMMGSGTFYIAWENGIREKMDKVCGCQTAYPDSNTAYHMILASQIHMTNNRLGIIPQMEAVLADVLYVCEES